MGGKSAMCDFMVIASGRSARQVSAIAEHLIEMLKPLLPATPPAEGLTQGDWVLVDGGDVVIHVFRPEVRAFYRLERMWGMDTPDRLAMEMAPEMPPVAQYDAAEDE